jgi:ABC-type transport system substrate-binding protein
MHRGIGFFWIVLVLVSALSPALAWDYGDPYKSSDTQYEEFGPRADELLIKLYASETAEWAALEAGDLDVTDWPLDAAHYATFNTNPALKVISYGADYSLYLFDLNNNNNEYLGNPEDPAYPNPVYPNPMSVVELRKAVAYLSDRSVINEVIGEGFAFPVYTPMSPASGFYVHPEIRPGGDLEDLCYLYDPAKAVQVLDNSSKFPIGLDDWRYWDMNLNGVKDAGEEMSLKLIARNDSAPRFAAAQKLYADLETLVKIHVTWTPGNYAAARLQVMGNKDFHIYTGGWSLAMDPDHLILWHWDYYWHPEWPYNYDGCNNPDYNDAADDVQYATTIEEATEAAHRAQLAFAENVLSVPLYSNAGSKVVSRTYVGYESNYHGKYWEGFVNVPAYGVDNYFTFLNMHPEGASQGGTIRYGFKTTELASLNPVYAGWLWDNTVIDLVGYESLLSRDPYTRALMPWLCDSFIVGTYDDGLGNLLTNVTFTMSRLASWSDGTAVTFDDIKYTFVTMKNDLAARGLAPPWWISNVQNIVQMIKHSDTVFEVRLDVKSWFAVGALGGNRILPKHIWQPICTGAIAPKSGLQWDPTTFAPDPDMIHSGPWCLDEYMPSDHILLKAHRPGVYNTHITTDPNKNSEDITSPNGYLRSEPYNASAYHDVALTDVRLSQGSATPGDLVGVQVGVLNNGTTLENIAITIYADADTSTIGDEQVIGTRHVILPSQASTTVEYVWDTRDAYPGNLVISAKATILLPDGNETNNMYVDGTIRIVPGIPDLAVTQVCPTQEAFYVGDPVTIEVYLQNQGNRAETANLTLYSDTDPSIIGDEVTIGTRSIAIGRYSSLKEVFDWDTAGMAAGDYNLTACITPLASEVDVGDNNRTEGIVRLFESVPCPDVNVTCPGTLVVNPSIFTYDSGLQARLINIGNVSIKSTGFEGGLRVVGSRNGTIRLCMNEPDVDDYTFYLPLGGEVQVPLWLVFQPETHWESYDGTYTLNLTVCGTHRRQLTIKGISITVCQNGAYIVSSETVSFSWNLTGGSLVYLEAEPDLPPGWTYSVNPPVGTFFETPQIVNVNITAPSDAKEGDIGKVTLRAYKNSTGQMIWQFIYFACTDNKPPAIESVDSPTVTPNGQLVLNATVSDPSGIMETVLHYSVDYGEWQNQTMQWMSGDTLNTTLYRGAAYYGTGPTTVRYYVSAVDWLGNRTDSPVQTVEVRNDITVTGLSVENSIVSEMNHVQANVTVRNNGTLPLSFANIALYANSTLMATYTMLDLRCNEDINVNTSLVLPKGNYIITAYAAGLPDEVEMSNNARTAGVYNHYEIAASAVAASKTVVGQDYPTSVAIAVENQGNFTETFNVTLYANTTIVETTEVTLTSGNSTTLDFTWNTSGFAFGNYSISAYVTPVEGETLAEDNTFVDGVVTVVLAGDLNDDGIVDYRDINRVARMFGKTPGSPQWDPNSDIIEDGIIDYRDINVPSRNYGKTRP